MASKLFYDCGCMEQGDQFFKCETCKKHKANVLTDADVDALEQPDIVLSDELREKLTAAMAESDRLGPPIIAPDAAWTYHALKGQAAVACRTHDQHNRRITDFISLETSPGRNAVADAVLIAKLLNEDERLRADALAPPEPCAWTLEDEDGSAYQTSCGNMFEFNDGGPVENKAKFCQYCGKALVVSAPPTRAEAL